MKNRLLASFCIVVLLCACMIYLGVSNRKQQKNKASLYVHYFKEWVWAVVFIAGRQILRLKS